MKRYGRAFTRRPLLRWAPPTLVNPITINLTTGNTIGKRINLADGQDYIVQFPETAIMHPWLELRGGRNVVVIGGEINLARPHFDEVAGLGLYEQFPKMTLTPVGVVGGSFRLRTAQTASSPYTGSIPWDATAADIKAALEAVVGAGSVGYAVGGAGGPWEIAPALYDNRLGRVVVDATNLSGAITQTNAGWGQGFGIRIANWSGTLHVEGLWVHGVGCNEAVNVDTVNDGAIAQFQSCRFDVEFFRYHNDHHHSDALQIYRGPTEVRTDRCDFFSPVQGSIFQPRKEPGYPPTLQNWKFSNTFWKATANSWDHRAPGVSLYKDHNLASWRFEMRNCYALSEWDGGGQVWTPDFPHWFDDKRRAPAGVTVGEYPPNGGFCDPNNAECGVDYRSRGYISWGG